MSLIWLAQTENDLNFDRIINNVTLSKIVHSIIIIFVAYLSLFINEKVNYWLSEKVPNRFRLIIKQSLPLIRAIIIGLTIISLLRLFLRLSTNNLLALTGTVSVALGFAFKDYASSLIGGMVALFEMPYRVGDRIQVGEHYGEVISFGLRGIKLRTPDDNVVTIPHNKIWTEAISNANDGALEAQVVADFYFAHNVDIELVMKILYQAAYTSQYTQLKLPIVVTMEETPWATHLMLKAYPMDARDENLYRTDLIKRSKQALANCQIPYPTPWGYEKS
ncbi:MAG: mechanosensitive ion channel family protein [Xenococcaceae cyanobacterium MO_167.B27]|nr:mechanosensitive ion channel family protein [Xenococcaceae cyanobacterium MO_167.B27]